MKHIVAILLEEKSKEACMLRKEITVEGRFVSNIIHQQDTHGSSVVSCKKGQASWSKFLNKIEIVHGGLALY